MPTGAWIWVRNVPSKTRAALVKASATLPRSTTRALPPIRFPCACTLGASGRSASSASKTAGSTSYSTRIRRRASSARVSSAATTATSSPTKRTISSRGSRSASIRTAGTSRCVSTACTPGIRVASEISILTIRAWACGLRSTRPYSMPGRLRSAVACFPLDLVHQAHTRHNGTHYCQIRTHSPTPPQRLSCLRCAQPLLACRLHRRHNLVVGVTAAEVPHQFPA